MKTSCVLKDYGNHFQGYDICSYYGMKLFVIDTVNTQTQLFDSLAIRWPTPSSVATFHIDGVKDASNGKWYYYSNGTKTLATTDLIWKNNATSDTGCLITLRVDTGFKVAGVDCSTQLVYICELK